MSSWFAFADERPCPDVRLFCFPYAGGTAAAYKEWRNLLPVGVAAYPLQYPGRGGRSSEALCTHLPGLVDEIVIALLPYVREPFAFFGYSMGALLAFEVARKLRHASLPQPERLLVAARNAPRAETRASGRRTVSNEEIIVRLKEFGGIPDEVFDGPELLEYLLPVWRADFELIDGYTFYSEAPFDFPITAMAGTADRSCLPQVMSAWKLHTSSAFNLFSFNGGHFFMEKNLRAVVDTVAHELGTTRSALATSALHNSPDDCTTSVLGPRSFRAEPT